MVYRFSLSDQSCVEKSDLITCTHHQRRVVIFAMVLLQAYIPNDTVNTEYGENKNSISSRTSVFWTNFACLHRYSLCVCPRTWSYTTYKIGTQSPQWKELIFKEFLPRCTKGYGVFLLHDDKISVPRWHPTMLPRNRELGNSSQSGKKPWTHHGNHHLARRNDSVAKEVR